MQNISKDVRFVGVNDHKIDLFEGQYVVPNGMSYNSYLLLDERVCVFDTVDGAFGEEWLSNLERELGGRGVDYLIVQHMEPDHSACIGAFSEKYPEATIVASRMAFTMMQNFFGTDFSARRIVVSDGDTLLLGRHELSFVTAPMVHWPEVIMTYDKCDKVLFSADAFGKFGARDVGEEWACEARRYYIGIVGKYGAQVQAVLKKAAALQIRSICPLHGPCLTGDLTEYLSLYDTWSAYRPEEEGVTVAYTSVYGNTKKAALYVAQELSARGVTVAVHDLARTDMAEAVEDAFRYSRLVLATTTYNTEIFPYMYEFIRHLTERGYQNRKIALIENGSWAPAAAKVMRSLLEGGRDLTFCENTVSIRSAVNDETLRALTALVDELC